MPDADTLKLYIDNDRDLYMGQRKSIEDNLLRKKNAGTYNFEKSKKLWEHLAESGAKKYAQENKNEMGFATAWYQLFSPGDRRAAAAMLAREFEAEWKLGNYADRQRALETKAQRAASMKSAQAKAARLDPILRDTGFAKQVSLRGMDALSGPFKLESTTDTSFYFRDRNNELYFFTFGKSESQKTGFLKRMKGAAKVKTVRGPSDEAMRGAPGWKKKATKKKATKKPKGLTGPTIKKVANRVLKKYPGLVLGKYPRFKKDDGSFSFDVKKAGSQQGITFTTWDDERGLDLVVGVYDGEETSDGVDARNVKTEAELERALVRAVESAEKDVRSWQRESKTPGSGGIVMTIHGERELTTSKIRGPVRAVAKRTTKKRTSVQTIAGPMETTPTGRRPASAHTRVSKVGRKYHLVVGGRTAAIFSSRTEADDIADVLNEMTLAQAKKEVGL